MMDQHEFKVLVDRVNELEKVLKDKEDKCWYRMSLGTSCWFVVILAWYSVTVWGFSPEGRMEWIPVTYGTLHKAGIIEVRDDLKVIDPKLREKKQSGE